MVFLKAHLSNREDDIHFLIKCLIEHIESDITKKEPSDEEKERIKRLQEELPNTPKDLLPKNIKDSKGKKPEKMDSMKVSGEQIYQTVRSKQALQQLKDLQNNPSIKQVLDRLKRPAFSFSVSSNLSSKEKTEMLEESLTAKYAGQTREVLRYVIDSLEAVKDTQDGGASKKSAAAIIDKIKVEDKRLQSTIKRKGPKNIQDNISFTAPTLTFWNTLAKEMKEIHVKIRFPLDKNGGYNAGATKTLVDMGEGLVSFILDNMDKKINPDEEVDIPPQFYEGERLAPKDRMETSQEESYAAFASRSEDRKKKKRGVKVLSQRKLTEAKRGATALTSQLRRDSKTNPFPRSKLKKAETLPYAAANASKTEEKRETARFIDMIDFTRFKNGRVKIIPRTLAYDDKTTGMAERNKNIEIIRTARDRKEFKDVSLSDIVKRYANYRKESSAKSKQKSDVKEIQAYMAERKKEIIASLDAKAKIPKVPKTLLTKYGKLNDEIVKDLKKYYSFIIRRGASQDEPELTDVKTGKNMKAPSVGGKFEIQESDLKRIKNDSGYKMILAIRDSPSDLGNKLKELIEVAKKADDDKQKELDKETLDEYIRLGQSIVDLQEDFVDYSEKIKESIKDAQFVNKIIQLVEYLEFASKKYERLTTKIKEVSPTPVVLEDRLKVIYGQKTQSSENSPEFYALKDIAEKLEAPLKLKNKMERTIIGKIKSFSGDEAVKAYGLDGKTDAISTFLENISPEDLGSGENTIADLLGFYESATESRLADIFIAFESADLEAIKDLKIDIDKQTENLKKIQDKIEEVKIYFNHTTTEREEQQMLFEFVQIKAKKLRGEKITDKSEMLKLLAERFRNNPVFTIEGKKITEYPEIAAYLEEKYEDVVGVDGGELKDFLDSAQEGKEEEE